MVYIAVLPSLCHHQHYHHLRFLLFRLLLLLPPSPQHSHCLSPRLPVSWAAQVVLVPSQPAIAATPQHPPSPALQMPPTPLPVPLLVPVLVPVPVPVPVPMLMLMPAPLRGPFRAALPLMGSPGPSRLL